MTALPGALVLVVDDSSTVRSLAAKVLRQAGYQALEAASIGQARPMLRAPLCAAVVCDQMSDGMAADLLPELQVPVIVLATKPGSAAAAQALAAGAKEVIERQSLQDDLSGALKRALETAAAKPAPALPPLSRKPQPSVKVALPPAATSSPEPLKVAEPRAASAQVSTLVSPEPSADESKLLVALREELKFLRTTHHYRVLAIVPELPQAEIEQAYARFCTQWDPGRLAETSSQEMRAIVGEILEVGKAAYAELRDPSKRAQYRPSRTLVPRKTLRPKSAPAVVPLPLTPIPVTALSTLSSAPGTTVTLDEPDAAVRPLEEALFDDIEAPATTSDEDPRFASARNLLREHKRAEARSLLDTLLAEQPTHAKATALRHVIAALEAGGAPGPDGAAPTEVARELSAAIAADPECIEALALQEQLENNAAAQRQSVLQQILPPGKPLIIAAIVAAFTHSEASAMVGTDALRMVLEVQYLQMLQTAGILDLAPLWKLLQAQPTFAASQAIPPLCRIKTWERELRLQVALPMELAGMTATERDVYLAKCRVPEAVLLRALKPEAAGGQARLAPPRLLDSVAATPAERKRLRRGGLLLGLSSVAVVASIAFTFAGTGPRKVSAQELSTEIPLADARQSGEVVGAFLTDPQWLGHPEPERRRQVEKAFAQAQSFGASELVIMDSAGVVRAQAFQKGDQPGVIFP